MKLVLAIAAGGAIGALGRYFVGYYALRLLGSSFPFGTLIVNIFGSFLVGVLIALISLRGVVNEELRVFLTVGVLGGFTTFSAFSHDFYYLIERGDILIAGGYVVLTVSLALMAVFAGINFIRAVGS